MDSDIYFQLDRPHAVQVFEENFSQLLHQFLRENDTHYVPKYDMVDKMESKLYALPANMYKLSDSESKKEPIELKVIDRKIDIGLIFCDKKFVADFKTLQVKGSARNYICPISLSNDSSDPTKFSVSLTSPRAKDEVSRHPKKRLKRGTGSRSNNITKGYHQTLLLDLQVSMFEQINRELLILKQMKRSKTSGEITVEFPSLSFTLEHDSKSIKLIGSIFYSVQANYSPSINPYPLISHNSALKDLLDHFITASRTDHKIESRVVDSLYFYRSISRRPSIASPKQFNCPELVPTLLNYQKESLFWCLAKEGKIYDQNKGKLIDQAPYNFVGGDFGPRSLWIKIPHMDFGDLWINRYTGMICQQKEFELICNGTSVSNQGGKGLLAEEMGLGKTVEIIALILLNSRTLPNELSFKYDLNLGREVIKSKTTLIISPASISGQWIREIKRHAPTLSVYYYLGLGKGKKRQSTGSITAEALAEYDIVVTTYNVIAAEVHYAFYNPLKRPSRSTLPIPSDKQKLVSPLVQMEFWRVVLDEAQMVNTGISNAAKVARVIPRFHAWGVTGTPVKNNMMDLQGLLVFLNVEPFSSSLKSWTMLTENPYDFQSFFCSLALRHSKEMVKSEIEIPPQRRILLSIPFTSIEENNYDHLYQEFLKECGFSNSDDFLPKNKLLYSSDNVILGRMSQWLLRLRQTCCHARIGFGNRRALGGGSIRTVVDVLGAMLEQAESTLLTDRRKYFLCFIERGQLLEAEGRPQLALKIWLEALDGIWNIVASLRESIKERNTTPINSGKHNDNTDSLSDADYDDVMKNNILRLRSWLELQHRCLFFIASAYFQLQTNSEAKNNTHANNTIVDDALFNISHESHQMELSDAQLSQLEEEYYGKAEVVRQEILQESMAKVEKYSSNLIQTSYEVLLCDITCLRNKSFGNVSAKNSYVLSGAEKLMEKLNAQALTINSWLFKLRDFLLKPLKETADPHGGEYENSLDYQAYAFDYLEVIQQVIADRSEAITGNSESTPQSTQPNLKTFSVVNQDLLTKLKEERYNVCPNPTNTPNFSLRGVLLFVRSLINSSEISSSYMLQKIAASLSSMFEEQKQNISKLSREISNLRDAYNARVEYYRQLQEISDNVVGITVKSPEEFLHLLNSNSLLENQLLPKVNQQLARIRYLESLKIANESVDGNDSREEDRFCVICQNSFMMGSLTVCGHQFCRECLTLWWNSHKSCPVCKNILRTDEVYNFTYRAKDITETSENTVGQTKKDLTIAGGLYANLDNDSLCSIQQVSTRKWYGSKIDWIIKHLIWLRTHDTTVQVVIFSQWKDMLDLLSLALTDHDLKYATVDHQMEAFRSSPEITCFLLHAKTQAAGLNLVNATHVYLCEPLVNTALELQAISRIHRIGQRKPTTVWNFTTKGTVEESIFSLSLKRRLDFLTKLKGDNLDSSSDEILDEALNSLDSNDMSKSLGSMVDRTSKGGEVVNPDDVIDALFMTSKSYK